MHTPVKARCIVELTSWRVWACSLCSGLQWYNIFTRLCPMAVYGTSPRNPLIFPGQEYLHIGSPPPGRSIFPESSWSELSPGYLFSSVGLLWPKHHQAEKLKNRLRKTYQHWVEVLRLAIIEMSHEDQSLQTNNRAFSETA